MVGRWSVDGQSMVSRWLVDGRSMVSQWLVDSRSVDKNCLGYQTILLIKCFVTFHHETGKGGKVKGGSFCILEKVAR